MRDEMQVQLSRIDKASLVRKSITVSLWPCIHRGGSASRAGQEVDATQASSKHRLVLLSGKGWEKTS